MSLALTLASPLLLTVSLIVLISGLSPPSAGASVHAAGQSGNPG